MFTARRDELFRLANFYTHAHLTKNIHIVEAWKYKGVETCDDTNFRHLVIKDSQIQDWIDQKDDFAPLSPPTTDTILEGSIRLLFCPRIDYRPPGFGMSQESFIAIEKGFHLPTSTLESIFSYQGIYSKHSTSSRNVSENSRIGLTVKVPQKMPVANYALSMSFDPKTKTTTGLIHGAFMHERLPMMRNLIWRQPLDQGIRPFPTDYSEISLHRDVPEGTQFEQIVAHLQSGISEWCHPLLLSVILVYNYRIRFHIFAWDLDDQVVMLERQTGVVFAGRTVSTKEMSIVPESLPRQKIRDLTRDMHTLMTEIIFFERVVEWTGNCVEWLEEVETQLNIDEDTNSEVLEMIRYMRSDSKSMIGYQRALKERVQSQINVLYSYIGQIDNSINAKIAVSSARDSSAMKTLALITTLFLPGTYIATLFSMSMFSWSSSSDSSTTDSSPDPTISSRFWIYWAVTIPLTLTTMLIWRLWWLWQERNYNKEADQAAGIDAPEKSTSDAEEWMSAGGRAREDDVDSTSVISSIVPNRGRGWRWHTRRVGSDLVDD